MKQIVDDNHIEHIIRADQVDNNKIVAAKFSDETIFKLHRVSHNLQQYAFISMQSSRHWANGSHGSCHAAIKDVMRLDIEGVYQFDNQKEFAEWILKNS